MDIMEEQLQGRSMQVPTTSSVKVISDLASDQEGSGAEDDNIIPSPQMLKGSKHTQDAVEQRIKGLTTLNKNGTFKSQRGGNKTTNPTDHITNGHMCKHICNYCFGVSK